MYPLRRDACRRLRDPRPLPSKWEPKGPSEKPASELRSLVQELAEIKDFRRIDAHESELEAIGRTPILRPGLQVHHRGSPTIGPVSMPRLQLGRAIAVDGKRIRGANRNGDSRPRPWWIAASMKRAGRSPSALGIRSMCCTPTRVLESHPRPTSWFDWKIQEEIDLAPCLELPPSASRSHHLGPRRSGDPPATPGLEPRSLGGRSTWSEDAYLWSVLSGRG